MFRFKDTFQPRQTPCLSHWSQSTIKDMCYRRPGSWLSSSKQSSNSRQTKKTMCYRQSVRRLLAASTACSHPSIAFPKDQKEKKRKKIITSEIAKIIWIQEVYIKRYFDYYLSLKFADLIHNLVTLQWQATTQNSKLHSRKLIYRNLKHGIM